MKLLQEIDIYSILSSVYTKDLILTNVPMKEHTTIRVGGKVDYMVMADSIENIRKSVSMLSSLSIPFMIMGNGSNIVFSDDGYHGVIIKIGAGLSRIEVDG
ncbi:MAG TPA: UDP-N-acetylenolpyruvoylglucosamine reductase, partial [Clostridiaceae bacterium]|nr:UDP-N-acetylenolpyruvoylglucosamine reductase [Clostridiaceae bacterium]